MANTANISTLTTDFNIPPYYDDYDVSKGYYKLLFKPGYSVQGRELNQLQTVLQKQVDRLGKHLFKEGSLVLPGVFQINSANTASGPVNYVKVRDTDNSNISVDITKFLDQTVTGQTNGIKGTISYVLDGNQTSANTKTIYIDYRGVANSNASIQTFTDGEVLVANVGTLVAFSANAIGFGSAFSISEGVVFAKEHLIAFNPQGIILDRYNSNPTCKVGFDIEEQIITASDDLSLLDPALESSNYSAPGADRLKLDAKLSVIGFTDPSGPPDFVTLFTIKNGIMTSNFQRTEYNILQDEMAKRTFDESGHYYVRGLSVSTREHLDTGINGGRHSSANGGNSNTLSVEISSGLGYVQGYEVSTLVPTYLTADKSLDYSSVNNQLATAAMGSYIKVKEVCGAWTHDQGILIDLYDTAQRRLTENKFSTSAQSGTKLGSARFMGMEWQSGSMGTPNAVFNAYLSDIRMMGSNTFSNVRSVYYDHASQGDIGADIVLSSNVALVYDSSINPMLHYVGFDFTKTTKPAGISDTTFTYKTSTQVSNVALGTFNLALPAGASQFPYGTVTLGDSQKRDIMVELNADANVTLAGTVTNTGLTLTGTGTNFDRLNAGDKVMLAGITGISRIAFISSATQLNLTSAISATATAVGIVKVYKTGDIVDMTLLGATAGATRTVTATPTQLSFDLKQQFSNGAVSTGLPATVSYRVSATTAPPIGKTLRADRFVSINVATHWANTRGPYPLGIPDVYKIKEIRLDTTAFTTNTQGSNAVTSFIFDNGQRDNYYDFASITPKSPLATDQKILVRLDHFEPDYTVGKGFFAIDSYPINDAIVSQTTIQTAQIPIYKSPTSGENYDIRNYLDFRPVKSATATSATTVGTATVNPANSAAFGMDVNGLRIPAAFSQISFDFEYYLARKDVVTMSKDKTFSIIRGVPASVPVTPAVQDSIMSLGIITITPYPSLSLYYANRLGRRSLACTVKKTSNIRFTMRDIGVLKDRIINLEYYAALSLLEKSALDLKIIDANGLDRFKNGIFVDTFSNHSLGATYNYDYRIVVDPIEKSIRPIFNMNSTEYDFLSGSNVTKTGDLVTLSFSETVFLSHVDVTTTRNTERSRWRFVGVMTLDPSLDMWVDTQFAPDQSVTFGPSDDVIVETTGGVSATWNSWQTTIVGYRVFSGTQIIDSALVGTYNTADEAYTVANQLSGTTDATVEAMLVNQRTGVENYTVVDTTTQSLGEKVIDVSIIPYIRPQVINIMVRGLKPLARFYLFFDRVNMSAYTTPLTLTEYDDYITTVYTALEGTSLRADTNGIVYCQLRLPAGVDKRFTVGTKEVLITDSPTNSALDATSYATGYFVAQGLVQTKQGTIISTRALIQRAVSVEEAWTDTNVEQIDFVDPNCCLAYTFQIKAPLKDEGLFITSMDLYCAEKHPDLGVWFEIREIDSGGKITRNQVPLSDVWVNSSAITLSTDGKTNPLNIKFRSPIFLQKNKYYALIIHPEGGNPNYYFWVSRLGETDINTGLPINSRINTGLLSTSNNGDIFTDVDSVDLVFKAYRALFITNTTGTATLGNKAIEKFYIANLSSSLVGIGETWYNGDRLTLSSITGGTIGITDFIIGGTSTMNSTVIIIDTTYNMSNTGYTSGEGITVRRANGLLSGITATISSFDARANATLYKSTERATQNMIRMTNSNGRFKANDRIFSASRVYFADIVSVGNYRYSVVDLEPTFLQFGRAPISFEMKTYSNTAVAGSYVGISPSENYYFTDEKALYSRTNEVLTFAGARTNEVRASLSSTSDFVSPVLDVGRTQNIIVDSILNSNTSGETAASGGALYNRYISKTVTLAEGQDAEDMVVRVTGYRPPTTDIKVWARILHNEDAEPMSNKGYIELEKQNNGNTVYSSISDRSDWIEYEYRFPTANLTGSLGQVQYRNQANTYTFTGYKYFAIKIGLLGDNSAVIPRAADIQVIGLQI